MTALVPYVRIEERPEKIHPRHLEQTAIVYIRQSSLQQVHRNQESTKLQYSLVDVARELGWARDRVVVIDDDLGVSGSSAIGREGFQRVLSEVALDLLRVNVKTIYAELASGRLPHVMLGRRIIRIPRAVLASLASKSA
jgi:excisionase family DNA binding protein